MVACIKGHTAFIYERGGKKMIDQIRDISKIVWERTRDGVSETTVHLEADSCSAQRGLINSMATHRHELVVFRGQDRVWEGPLHRIGDEGTGVDIVAHDVLEYGFSQPLTQVWSNANPAVGPVTTRVRDILEYEFSHGRTQFYSSSVDGAADAVAEWVLAGGVATPVAGGWDIEIPALESDDILPSINVLPYLDVRNSANEAETSAVTAPYEMTVGDHLAGLGRQSGIDYTTVGRSIVVWDVSRSLGRLEQMTEANFFSQLIVSEYGADHAQSAYVVGQDGAYGAALNLKNLAFYGPWTTIYTPYNEEGTEAPTVAALNSQAQRNLSGRSPSPIEVRVPDNSGIILTESLTINQLVCGVQIPLRATLNARQLDQLQKLDHLTVTETGEGGETIQVTLTPATKPDSDDEEDD